MAGHIHALSMSSMLTSRASHTQIIAAFQWGPCQASWMFSGIVDGLLGPLADIHMIFFLRQNFQCIASTMAKAALQSPPQNCMCRLFVIAR